MKIAIIGAGFTGLAAAYRLSQNGHAVTVFEKDNLPGGLAIGYQEKGWDWTLEKHYHHWFTNDTHVLQLAKEIDHPVIVKTPQTNWYVNGKIYKFVSLKAALTFPLLTPLERIRQLFALAILRINPFWQPLEKFKTDHVMPILMGKKAYRMLWQTILFNKFGKYATDISLAWFWARIKKRTQSLAYPQGGFLEFAQHLQKVIEKNGGNFSYKSVIEKIYEKNGTIIINTDSFDKAIVTLPSISFLKIAPQLPNEYKNKLMKLHGIGATNLVLRLKEPFFSDNTYWLSVADTKSPVMAIVEHTNFMDKKYYNNEHIIYIGNYLPVEDSKFTKTKEELLSLYDPFLKRINKNYRKYLIGYEAFKAPFAQPIVTTNYSKLLPSFTTPLKNVYLANIQQVYPWDRGTNYSIEIGYKVAGLLENT